jgi:hypothetical protein
MSASMERYSSRSGCYCFKGLIYKLHLAKGITPPHGRTHSKARRYRHKYPRRVSVEIWQWGWLCTESRRDGGTSSPEILTIKHSTQRGASPKSMPSAGLSTISPVRKVFAASKRPQRASLKNRFSFVTAKHGRSAQTSIALCRQYDGTLQEPGYLAETNLEG